MVSNVGAYEMLLIAQKIIIYSAARLSDQSVEGFYLETDKHKHGSDYQHI